MFKTSTYVNRRNVLKQKVGSGILLFLGNQESPMNYTDNTYTFRQDSCFLYYFGINRPSLTAIIDIDNDTEIIFGDDFSMDEIVWVGSQIKLREQVQQVGIDNQYISNKLDNYLQKAIARKQQINYLPPYRHNHILKLSQLLGSSVGEIVSGFSVEFIKAIVAQREIKSEEEIVKIENAVDVSVDMHLAAIRCVMPGMTEAQVAAKVHEIALANGGDIGFPIIATKNGQTLHNHYHGNVLKEGDLFLLDAGYQNPMGYTGDLTSTFPVSKQFTSSQKEIFSIVSGAINYAVAYLRPGINFKEVHKQACLYIIDRLKELDLMTGDSEEAYESGAHALFFPCGLGHMLGLDVHDMENLGEKWVGYDGAEHSKQFGLKSLRLAKPLKENFVLTIEPGIYFIPELIDNWKTNKINSSFLNWEKIDVYRSFGGVRIEDNYVITDKGYRLLGKPFKRELGFVEAIRQGIE